MAKAIANLAVSLTARTKSFRRKMKDAQKTVRGFSTSITRSAKRIATFGVALTSLAAGGGLALLVKRSFESIDALGKTSDKLGIATDKLAGLQLQAKRSGVNVRTFSMGLQRMTRRMAEAATGTGEAQAAIKELGLDAKALNKLTPDQQLLRIADAMELVSNQADRVRLGFKLFDSEGVALINTLRGGSKALEETFKEVEKLGGAFNRIEVRQIENANDAIDELRLLIGGKKGAGGVAIGLAPLVEALADSWKNVGTEVGDMSTITQNAIVGMGRGIDWIIGRTTLLQTAFSDVTAGIAENMVTALATATIIAQKGTFLFSGVFPRGAVIAGGLTGAGAASIGNELIKFAKGQREMSAALLNAIIDRGSPAGDFFAEVFRSSRQRAAAGVGGGGGGVNSLLGAGGGGGGFGLQVGQLRQFVPGGGAAKPVPVSSPSLDTIAANTGAMLRFFPGAFVPVFGP